MIVLGIETSCDETAVGIVDNHRNILAHVVYSQIKEHAVYGGVVPEIAARAHVAGLDHLIRAAMHQSGLEWSDIDGVAATCGPGLIGGVMVGMMTAKAIAAARKIPFLAVNHLEGHVLTVRLSDSVPFPYLTLLISGGHTQILLVRGLGDYELLGESLDDAAGEAFDKGAKMMGLPYPGGPVVDRLARACPDAHAAAARFPLPRPLLGRPGCDFSFAGLKTAMRMTVDGLPDGPIDTPTLQDLCAALQGAITDVLADRVAHALPIAAAVGASHFVLAGGVAANSQIRSRLSDLAAASNMTLVAPPLHLCTDNGVMIAWAGLEYLEVGRVSALNLAARPRWPLAKEQKV